MVRFVEDTLIDKVYSYDIILVGMGINGSFSGGFAYDVALNFPRVAGEENDISPYGDRRLYGTVFPIVEDGITFCMCYIHDGGHRKWLGDGTFVHYDYLESCLRSVAEKYKGKRIACPLLGCSKTDGAGDKDTVKGIFEKVFQETDIDVYCYEQETFDDVMYRELVDLRRRRREEKIPYDEYKRLKNEIYWKRNYGIFKKMPDEYEHKKSGFSWENVISVEKKRLGKVKNIH